MEGHHPLWLLADIGATHARFALYDPQQQSYTHDTQTLVAQYDSLAHACKSYLKDHAVSIDAAAIAIACPILGDQVTMTNHPWNFSQQQFKSELQLNHLLLLNDQVATAYGIPFLPSKALRPLGPHLENDNINPKGILAPGSGLGTATLIPTSYGWHAFASEGGHVTLAPTNDFEAQIIGLLTKKQGHISAECLASGLGIINLYETICDLKNVPPSTLLTPSCIVAAAANDPCAQQTLVYFTRFLGNIAGNLALSLGARGGIYLAGGIIPKLGIIFDEVEFRQAFETKGRFADYLSTIPTFLITHPLPAFVGLQQIVLAAK